MMDRLKSFARRAVRGRAEDPVWVRPALLALLVATGILYLWDLGSSGWANAYYSAAVQAMSESWKAFFFGSFDASNFITVDKPPASLWVMALSARVFGVNAWSILVPQALMGVASVALLYAAVRRWSSAGAGLIAGAVLALTPVAALMFRYNNPDALLVLLLVGAVYCTMRAIESGRTWWLIGAAALVGTGFNTKMLQAFLIVPVIAVVYLVAAKPRIWKRIWQVALAGVALVVSSSWWVAIVELWPASSRPYIGGSQTNSLLDLIFGYNGFGRLTGNETGSVGGGGGGAWGETGFLRLFSSDWGGQIAWLIPAAVILGVAGLWISRCGRRTDRLRASVLLWGGWLVVTWAVFSFGAGIIHNYYAVALAPAIGALVGIGTAELWRRREHWAATVTLASTLAATSVWAFVLLERSGTWLPALRYVILIGGLAAALALALLPLKRRPVAIAVGAAGLVLALLGPAAYAIDTAATPHTGSLPTAGPSVDGGTFAGGGPGGQGGPGGLGGQAGFAGRPGGMPPGQQPGNGSMQPPNMGQNGSSAGASGIAGTQDPGTSDGQPQTSDQGASQNDGTTAQNGPGGAAGGLLDASTPSAELVELLTADADDYDWVAATPRAQAAAGLQLATSEAVMAMGGFNGSDPAPTLEEFKAYVEAGRIHYYVAGQNGGPGGGMPGGTMPAGGMAANGTMPDDVMPGGGAVQDDGQMPDGSDSAQSAGNAAGPNGPGGGDSNESEISSWVAETFSSTTIDGVTVYDLTDPL